MEAGPRFSQQEGIDSASAQIFRLDEDADALQPASVPSPDVRQWQGRSVIYCKQFELKQYEDEARPEQFLKEEVLALLQL